MKNGRYLNNEFITPEGIRLSLGDAAEEVVKVKRAYQGESKAVSSPYDLQKTHSQTLSKSKMNELINEIRQNGIKDTVKYVEHNGQKYIVDGHNRVIAAKRLGIKEVPIEQVQLSYAGYNTIEDLLWFD